MSRQHGLGGDAADGAHGQSSVEQLVQFVLGHLRAIGRSGESEVPRLAFTPHRGLNRRNSDDGIEEADPQ